MVSEIPTELPRTPGKGWVDQYFAEIGKKATVGRDLLFEENKKTVNKHSEERKKRKLEKTFHELFGDTPKKIKTSRPMDHKYRVTFGLSPEKLELKNPGPSTDSAEKLKTSQKWEKRSESRKKEIPFPKEGTKVFIKKS